MYRETTRRDGFVQISLSNVSKQCSIDRIEIDMKLLENVLSFLEKELNINISAVSLI